MKSTANHSITRIHNPSKKEFAEFWQQGQPFIINGATDNWAACKKWSNDYLVNVCGNNPVPVEVYSQSFFKDYNYARVDNYHSQTMQFEDYIDIVAGKKKDDYLSYYMAQVDFQKYFPELTDDISFPEYFSRKLRIVYLFFGFANKKSASATYLHFDEVHNIFVQIRGRKRFLLFPPSDYLSFYPPLEDNRYSSTSSKVNPDNPNLELFPKFPLQAKREVILEPGEILYIPPFWWHHVTAVDENISLTFWYPPSIKDFFRQKGILPTFLQIAPHVIPRLIYSQIRKMVRRLIIRVS